MAPLLKIPGWTGLPLAVVAGAVACFLAGKTQVAWDVTQDKRHSLTSGTRELLAGLERPVTVRYYVSRSDNELPVDFRNYSEYITGFLGSVEEAGGGMVKLEVHDPRPGSDAEQSALLDGIEAQAISADTAVFMGIAFSSAGGKAVVPFLDPGRQNSLEYDVLRNIQNVSRTERPKIGIISALPVNREGSEWFFSRQLGETYELVNIGSKEPIPDDISSLLIAFPSGVSRGFDEKLDAFTARGGSLVVLMDSLCLCLDFLGMATSASDFHSRWEGLDRATGLRFTPEKAVLDTAFRTELDRGEGIESLSYFLTLNELGINGEHEVTRGLSHLNLPVSGTFLGRAHPELEATTLLSSTDQSRLAGSQKILTDGKVENERLNSTFQPDGETYPIGIAVEGRLRSFATGAARPDVLPSRVVLVGDADFVADPYTGVGGLVQGKPQFQPINNNIGLVVNSFGFLQNDTLLNSARARVMQARPLTRLAELERDIRERYRTRLAGLEQSLERHREAEMGQPFQGQGNGGMLDRELRDGLAGEQAQIKLVESELRSLKRGLRNEVQALESRIKWGNILGVPLLVSALGSLVLFRRHQASKAE